jgi:hypothetical protein
LLFAFPQLLDHSRMTGFASIYRVFGLLCLLVPMLVLGHWGWGSYLAGYEGALRRAAIAGGYEVGGLRRQRAGDLGRRAAPVAGHGEYRDHVLRHLPVHQVLRLVVGDDAEVAVLPGAGAGRDPDPAGAQAPAAGRRDDAAGAT